MPVPEHAGAFICMHKPARRTTRDGHEAQERTAIDVYEQRRDVHRQSDDDQHGDSDQSLKGALRSVSPIAPPGTAYTRGDGNNDVYDGVKYHDDDDVQERDRTDVRISNVSHEQKQAGNDSPGKYGSHAADVMRSIDGILVDKNSPEDVKKNTDSAVQSAYTFDLERGIRREAAA